MTACDERPVTAGPTWVLLRGLTRGADHWGRFADALRGAQPGAQVLTPELPGNGRAWAERSPARVAEMTEAVRAQLPALTSPTAGQRPERWLMAMSLGAMVACDWAQRHPGEVAGAVLINTSLRPFSPFWQRLRPLNWPTLLRAPWLRPQALETALLRMTSRRTTDTDATIARWVALRAAQPVRAANAARQLRAALAYRAPVLAPTPPLLVLSGAGDRLVHPACSRTLAARWGCPCVEHPWAGHDLPLDDPGWVIEQALAWQAACAMSPSAPLSR